jgi:signal transduction histidine kinase/ligand-binding sensor domain-containing protein
MKKIILIIFVFCFTILSAQFKRPFFNTISVENGLPEGNVQSSLQDKLGYLWFGTQNGLVRYDGYATKLYPIPDDDGKPSSTPSIANLFEDKQGVLWACVDDNGYFIYDRQNDVFKRPKKDNGTINKVSTGNSLKFVYDKKNNVAWNLIGDITKGGFAFELLDLSKGTVDLFSSKSKGRYLIPSGKTVADIMLDSSGNVWLSTDNVLSIYDRTSKSFKPFFKLPTGMSKILFNYLTQDPVDKDVLWISTYLLENTSDLNKAKIIQLNSKTKGYKTYDHIPSDPNSVAGTCTEVYIDPLKRMFFYTDHGISMYNRESGKFTNFKLTVPGIPTNAPLPITTIAADKEGNFWVGGRFNGLFFLNTTTAASTFYTHTDEAGSLPDFGSGINKIFYDKAGVLWVSMPWSGIAWLDPKRSFFNPIKINSPIKVENKKSGVTANHLVGKYNDSTFFVSADKSIFTWNYSTNIFKNITPKAGKELLASGTTITDKEGLIWMTTYGAGLFCYNPITKTTKNYQNDPKNSSSIGSNMLSEIVDDNKGNLWIGTENIGLISFNKKTGKFTQYPFIKNDNNIKANNVLDDDQVRVLLFGKNGILWIGTNNGSLNRFDTKTGKFTSYLDSKEGFNCITCIYEDSQNRLWAGSYLSGLFLVNKNSGFLKHFTEKDGLSSNDVRGIAEDKKGNIWLATTHGLSKLSPVTNKITNYTTINGLPVVRTDGIYKGSNGLFYVYFKNGLIPFDPDNIIENKVPPQVVIESIKYHTESNKTNEKDTILFNYGRQEVSLKYNENKISFQYVGLHFSNASLNQYSYQLEGYDKDWIQAGTQRTVTYTNLSPGDYTFKVRAANSDGVWNETPARFTFTISPPWWKTWWAYALYFLVFISLLRVYVVFRARNLKRENTILEEKIALRTNQLTKSIEDLKSTQSQLIQSEKMASLGELTAGIAHEIQNPLNFVNNFSEVSMELMDEMETEIEKGDLEEAKIIAIDIKQNLEKINYHGKRADSIVKGMLQHSRSSNGIKEPTDINKLADEYLRLAYHGLRAKDKSFNATMKTEFGKTIGNINIIPQDMGRVILNLITNAFYAVDEKKKQMGDGYEPTVTISTSSLSFGESRGEVTISVKDNGNGIPQKVLDKIFQPFFTTKPTGQGTGLGLSLSYDIVKAHGGELKVETKEGEGSEFVIQLPF